jgi:hypothetical protein
MGSLGGTIESPDASNYMSGTIENCIVTGNTDPTQLQGGTIINSHIENVTLNSDALSLIDSNSKIINTIVEVNDSGTGVPVNASSAQNVIAAGCAFNNGGNDADGIGANVTNTALTSGNSIY